MQTFLPYPSFVRSAAVLDRQRLGKQRVEAYQILRALRGESKGWLNHPATKMWRGYETALGFYGWVMCDEWMQRGYKDSLSTKIVDLQGSGDIVKPPWVGDDAFHLSHRSNLLRKNPEHYALRFPNTPDDLPYVWPVS